MATLSWKSVAAFLATQRPGQALRVASHTIEHPLDGGLHPTVALPVGQRGDYRMPLKDGGALHVYDFDRHYVALLENAVRAPLARSPHAEAEASSIAAGMALGSLVGLFLGRTSKAAAVGAAFGALAGAVSNSENYRRGVSDTPDRPATPLRVTKAVRSSNSTASGSTRGRKKQKP